MNSDLLASLRRKALRWCLGLFTSGLSLSAASQNPAGPALLVVSPLPVVQVEC